MPTLSLAGRTWPINFWSYASNVGRKKTIYMNAAIVKILIAVGLVLTICTLGLIVYKQEQIIKQQTVIQTQMVDQQKLVDGIVRSSSQWATKDDLSKFAADNEINAKAIQDNLDKLNAKLVAINVVHADSDGQNQTNVPSSSTGDHNPKPVPPVVCVNGICPSQDPFGYQAIQQNLALNEDFGTLKVPFGTVGFSAWQVNPWNVQVLPREYNIDTVVGKDVNERDYFYNKFTVKVGDKDYEIPIKTATTKQVYPAATFSWWNPRLLMGLDGMLNLSQMNGDIMPSISVGIMSWGQYKTTPDWSIVEVGLGYEAINKTAAVVITPVAYNIGKKLFSPIMSNTYIGPEVSIGFNGNVGVGAGLRVGF